MQKIYFFLSQNFQLTHKNYNIVRTKKAGLRNLYFTFNLIPEPKYQLLHENTPFVGCVS